MQINSFLFWLFGIFFGVNWLPLRFILTFTEVLISTVVDIQYLKNKYLFKKTFQYINNLTKIVELKKINWIMFFFPGSQEDTYRLNSLSTNLNVMSVITISFCSTLKLFIYLLLLYIFPRSEYVNTQGYDFCMSFVFFSALIFQQVYEQTCTVWCYSSLKHFFLFTWRKSLVVTWDGTTTVGTVYIL